MNKTRAAFVDRVARLAAEGRIPTPTLVMSEALLREKSREIGKGIPGAEVYYAAKANDDLAVLRIAAEEGLGFEVASIGEIEKLFALGVPPERIISSNPIKSDAFIEHARSSGIRMFALDSVDEIDKLGRLAPGCEAVIRLAIENDNAEWPLSGKFGAEPSRVPELLERCREKGVNCIGINFHVGSQCLEPASWDAAISLTARLFRDAREQGFNLSLLNLGGGYPSEYLKPVPGAAEIEAVALDSLRRNFPEGVRVFVEPGRFLVGEGGIYVTRVIGKARRKDGLWIFLDVGVFNGLAEAIGGIRYRIKSLKDGEPVPVTLTGPSCDGFDVIDKNATMIEPDVGDVVLMLTTGAYTTVYAANFNGFPVPPTRILEETWPI
jgi:ornithine decarboxylase